ncbi:MAG: GGDEF domain-containing protein [Thermodesulfobacteriota bacterium]
MQKPLCESALCPYGAEECPLWAETQRLQEECERLRNLSYTDHLTGLFNRRYLKNAIDQEMERTRRTGLPTSLIMIDLDYFKRINDTYGHQAGDEALKWVSQIWRKNLRRIDIPCRYGGEEFAVILPGTRLRAALRAAKRLQTALLNSPLDLQGRQVFLTASFGVDAYTTREELTVRGFVKRADHYLLEAKIRGRNQICYQQPEIAKHTPEVTMDERSALFGAPALPPAGRDQQKRASKKG